MNSADPFETFCAAVCAKVRWPFARWDITQELTEVAAGAKAQQRKKVAKC